MAPQRYIMPSRRKERFEPGHAARVTLYACGPTVYNPPHIGNARAAVVYDLLYRVLQRHYPNVVYARNITDVDDSILPKARELGIDFLELAATETARFHRDMAALDGPVNAAIEIEISIGAIAALPAGNVLSAQIDRIALQIEHGKIIIRSIGGQQAGRIALLAAHQRSGKACASSRIGGRGAEYFIAARPEFEIGRAHV